MGRRSEERGDPKATKPHEVKRILRLANASRNDAFYDLGCGHGRVCMLAAGKVRRAIGIEDHIATYREAVRQVRKAGLECKVKIRNSDMATARIGDATIVYTTLNEGYKDVDRFERVLKEGCRFISVHVPLIGIKPNQIDGMFFLMRVPFSHAGDEDDWARSVLRSKRGTATELYKKYRKRYGRKFVRELRSILSRRLKRWQKDVRISH